MTAHNNNKTLAIIDDDRNFCDYISGYFENSMTEILIAHTGAEGLGICTSRKVDVVLLDQKLPDAEGVDLCAPIMTANDRTKIIFITAYPSFDNAVKAIRIGAYDYLSKPFEIEELKLALDRAVRVQDLERVEQIQKFKNKLENKETVLIGAHRGLKQVQRLALLAAENDAPVLLTGETGTGKNLLAKSIHYSSHAKNAAFISHNCAAFPENLIEAELFGHEKGAFTGAVSDKKGILEMAEGGTLFLDEIGELPYHLQSKLLGVLDDKKIKRLGGQSQKPVDVRIIAATNNDLYKAMRNKRFREDLYYRLNVLKIHIPPLRERPEDIPELCRYLIKRIKPDSDIRISDDEIEKLSEYHWPGNVRELRNIIERSIILRQGSVIRPSQLLGGPATTRTLSPLSSAESEKPVMLKELEKNHIRHVLNRNSGNHTQTARDLGISRSTLIRKTKAYHLK